MISFFRRFLLPVFILVIFYSFFGSTNVSAREPKIYDDAGFFSAKDKEIIQQRLESLWNRYKRSAVIYVTDEDLTSYGKSDISRFVYDKAKKYGVKGLFIFISLKPKKLFILASKDMERFLPKDFRRELRNDVIKMYFKKGKFSDGIFYILDTMEKRLVSAKKRGSFSKRGAVAKKEASEEIPTWKLILYLVIGFVLIMFVVQFIKGLFGRGRAAVPPAGASGAGGSHYPGGYYSGSGGGFKNLLWGLFGGAVGAYLGHKIYDAFSGSGSGAEAYGSDYDSDYGYGDDSVSDEPDFDYEEDTGGDWGDDGGFDDGGDFGGGDDW